MDKRTLETLLAKYGDSLASGSWTFPPGIALTPEDRDELMALAQVRQWLVESLVMVQPPVTLQKPLKFITCEKCGLERGMLEGQVHEDSCLELAIGKHLHGCRNSRNHLEPRRPMIDGEPQARVDHQRMNVLVAALVSIIHWLLSGAVVTGGSITLKRL